MMNDHYHTVPSVRASSGRDASHYSPFTGGGDIYISTTEPGTSVSAVVLGGIPDQVQQQNEPERTNDPETEPPPNVMTPPKSGEQRCGAVEGKGMRAQQSPHDVTLQLQAGIWCCSAHTNWNKLCTSTLILVKMKGDKIGIG